MKSDTHFWVSYQISASNKEDADLKAAQISIEQSVEMPPSVVPVNTRNNIGRVEDVTQIDDQTWLTTILFNKNLVDGDATQLLNVLFGNISLQPWARLVDADVTYLRSILSGPAHGIQGIRQQCEVTHRALSCAVIKPIGTTSEELAEMAEHFTAGGIDLIKDDHGLLNQSSAPFKERVRACLNAIRKGEQVSGKRTLYFPNITTSPVRVLDRYKQAVEMGADGVLIIPQLTGLETLHEIASLGEVPLMAHPAFSGSMLMHRGGMSPEFYFGKLTRLYGADSIIYPNAQGRFSFSRELCQKINSACRDESEGVKGAFPTPGGGVDRETVSGFAKLYGNDVIFLIGGSLYKHPKGLKAAAAEFQKALSQP
jgi:ribulose-bisphosphate carboxylase large chain